MMSVKSLKLVLATTLSIVFSMAHASSKLPSTNSTMVNSLSPNEKGFAYPVPSITQQDLIETGVLFVYNDHILNFFGNDPEKLLEYVNQAVEYNNRAFANSNIPVKRVVSGLVYADGLDLPFWPNDASYNERLDGLTALQSSAAGLALANNTQYSYLVGLAGFEALENEAPIVGLSFLSGSVSWVSPYTTESATWSERTLAHELGHNDGFRHTNEDHQEHLDFLAREDATGFKCGDYASVMNVSGDRTEPFFSDTQITLHKHDHEETCGVPNQANSAQVYRDLAFNNITNREGTFSNLKPTRDNTGFVSIHANANTVLEGQNLRFDLIFEGAEQGDSVNIIVRKGSAGLNDYASDIMHITHNGIDNVYTIDLETFIDSDAEETETLSVELVFANGVSLIESNKSVQAFIVDADGQTTGNNQQVIDAPFQTVGSGAAASNNSASVVANSPALNQSVTNNVSESNSEVGGGSLGFYSVLLIALGLFRRVKP